VWELLERAGNFGVPLAFLILLGWCRDLPDWFSTRPMTALTEGRASVICWTLRVTTALLLIGHGGFDFAMHKDWSSYAAAIGINPGTLEGHPLRPLAGWFECALGLLVLSWPWCGLLIFVFAWKLGTEALRPLAGEPIWEFIERGGSYGAPLALAWLRTRTIGARSSSALAPGFARITSGGPNIVARLHCYYGPPNIVQFDLSSVPRRDVSCPWPPPVLASCAAQHLRGGNHRERFTGSPMRDLSLHGSP
jgi:hypothetical protein